ncbi:DUF5360 family protein [Paenibacillus sp. FSL W7-1287]|uniref:DUF5360 family protein n=1 Tax=Paenibacillus sp. FSL W7-1287 TaxID=2954538 RepID=UPI0030FC3892
MDTWKKALMALFLITDVGFILYWGITALKLIPPEYLYQDYSNPLLVSWNWSFFAIDIFISMTGFYSFYLLKKGQSSWVVWSIISLVLTFSSGLMAISFWSIRLDFDPMWWTPNLFLLIYPLCFIPRLLRELQNTSLS